MKNSDALSNGNTQPTQSRPSMDLSHWQTEDKFSMDEVACLIVGVDPLRATPDDDALMARRALALRQLDADYRSEADRLIDAVLHHWNPPADDEDKCIKMISWRTKVILGIRSIDHQAVLKDMIDTGFFSSVNSASDVEDRCYPVAAQRFAREEVSRWCNVRGWNPVFNFADKGHAARWHEEDDDHGTRIFAEIQTLPPESAPHPRTEKHYLALIAAMAIDKYAYEPEAERSSVPGDLAVLLRTKGYALTDEAVRGYLRNGAGHLNPKNRR